jgi:hypothetical protein
MQNPGAERSAAPGTFDKIGRALKGRYEDMLRPDRLL